MQSTRNSTRRAASHPCLTLLPAGVTRPPALLRTPVVSYTTFSPFPPPCWAGDVCFLWPYPADCSAPSFPRRRALWSADFPRPFTEVQGRDRPTNLRQVYHTFRLRWRQFPGLCCVFAGFCISIIPAPARGFRSLGRSGRRDDRNISAQIFLFRTTKPIRSDTAK